jgi:aryl-alcohol dehydrogenase-like predicted oxidoreductase
MELRQLGRSGCVVSTLALGTMTFGSETDEAGSHAQLDAFVAAGGNLVDTADVYSAGASEEIIGRWLAARPSDVRDGIVLATKGRFPTGSDANDAGLSRRHLQRALDASLRRLGVDSVDLYQVHAWDPLTPLEETMQTLDDMVRAGKIRYVGLSNFTGWQVQKAVDIAQHGGFTVPVTLQPQYNMPRRRPWSVAMVTAGRRLAHGQVPARQPANRRHASWREPRPRRRGLLPAVHPTADVGRGRSGPHCCKARRHFHGTGRLGLARRPTGRHVSHPWSSYARAASRQSRRGGASSRSR